MGAPRKERKTGEGLAETFEPASKVEKGALVRPFPQVGCWSSASAGPLLSRLRSPFSAFTDAWAGGRQTIWYCFIIGIGCNFPLGASNVRPPGDESFGTLWERKRPGLSRLVRESGRKVRRSALRQVTRRQHALRARPACPAVPPRCSLTVHGAVSGHSPPGIGPTETGTGVLQLPEGFAARPPRNHWRTVGGGPLSEQLSNP